MDNETKNIQLMRGAMDHCVEVAQQNALFELRLMAMAGCTAQETRYMLSVEHGE